MSGPGEARAPAKVNLFLHVGARQPDGYHPVASLMAFADFGDELTAVAAERMSLRTLGPFGDGLDRDDNLVLRAARLLAETHGVGVAQALTLDKRLPVAAGLGGGSSDAAATLRLLSSLWNLGVDEVALTALAARLGSDIAACLSGRAVIGTGRGEQLSAAPAMPALDVVLVNPGVRLSTAEVYATFDAAALASEADVPPLPDAFESAAEVAAVLAGCRNDLEGPAVGLAPIVGDLLDTLRDEPETLLARMSGSGATCFALCADDIAAESLAERIEAMRPDWWVRRCVLA